MPGHPLEDVSDAVIGHRGKNDRAAARDEIRDRGGRGEPGCERHRRAAFERAERGLEGAPGRIPVPAVLEARIVAVRRAEHERRVHRRARDPPGPAGLDRYRVGGPVGIDSQRGRVQGFGHVLVLISASGFPEDRLAADRSKRSERMEILDKPLTTKAGTDRFIGDAWFDPHRQRSAAVARPGQHRAVRARGPEPLAPARGRSDVPRHRRRWADAGSRRRAARDQGRRHSPDAARGVALARRRTGPLHDPLHRL